MLFQNKANGKFFDWSVHNQNALEQERRLQDVVLLYRQRNDWNASAWREAVLVNLDESRSLGIVDGVIHFATDGVENDQGYAALHWDLTDVADGAYHAKVQSRCNTDNISNPQREHAVHSTDTIEFVVDRTPPQIYGTPDLQPVGKADDVKHHEFAIQFTEALFCEVPYVFTLRVTLSSGEENQHEFSHDNGIFVKCEGEEIRFRFNMDHLESVSSIIDDLKVVDYRLELLEVEDLARNQMETFQFNGTWFLVSKDRCGVCTAIEVPVLILSLDNHCTKLESNI